MDQHNQPAPGYTQSPQYSQSPDMHNAHLQHQTTGIQQVGPIQHPDGAILSDKQQYSGQYAPQQNGISPQQVQGQHVQGTAQPIQARPGANYSTATPLASLQKFPAPVDCPICNVREMTIVHDETGGYTHAMAAIACFCCCLGCIPYMMGSFKNVVHKCGSCGAPLAEWHRSGSTEVLQHR